MSTKKEMSFLEQKKAGLIQRFRKLTAFARKKPDFIIIGAQKGGTSSLFYYLSQHPEIIPARKKEIHFFNLFFEKGSVWYKHFFPLSWTKKITGEATPAYLFHPQVPGRIREYTPNTKFIVMLRNPIARAYSHYNMVKKEGLENATDFKTAIHNELKRTEKDQEKINADPNYYSYEMHNFSYLARGKYSMQIKHWLKHFQKDQFLFIKSESFFEQTEEELKKVYAFLGLKAVLPKDLSPQFKGSYPQLDPEMNDQLSAYLNEENEQLEKLVGLSF